MSHQTGGVFSPQEIFDLIFRAADGREVELICSERLLRDPAQLIFRCLGNLDAKLQPFDKILQGNRLLKILLPLRAFLIHPGAVLIFFGRAHVIECPDMIQKRREQFRVPGQLQRQNAGAVDLGIRAINGVVIDEDETVQPKIEFFRE